MTGAPLPDVVCPCGCLIQCRFGDDGLPELHVIPCRIGCTVVQAAINAAGEAGIPVEERADLP